MWSGAGLNIDIDNLLTSPGKTVQATSAPSMNQLAKGNTPSPSHLPPSSSTASSFASAAAQAGPNYNINTASLMGPRPPHSQPGMGMGPRPSMPSHSQPGMGMPTVNMMGMGMGAPGMAYGHRPGMMPMYGGGYGMGPQPGMGMGQMGYGGMPPMMGGSQPMGAQQKLM